MFHGILYEEFVTEIDDKQLKRKSADKESAGRVNFIAFLHEGILPKREP